MYFDIGANKGDWALANINTCKKIIAVEASPSTYVKLRENCDNDNILLLNYAVCNNNGEDIIFYNSNFNSPFHNCEKFGEKNILTGDIEYNSASYCRKDEEKCGKQGKYFEQEPNLKFKMFKHFAVSSLPNVLSLIILSLALILVTLKKY